VVVGGRVVVVVVRGFAVVVVAIRTVVTA